EIEETESEKREETERETETEETERKETEDTEETTDLTEEYLADARAYINKNGVSDEREETERETETEETERKETEDTEETTDLTEEYLADARAYINKNGVSDEREETERETETEETERKETEDTEETTDLTEEYLADARAYINKNGVSDEREETERETETEETERKETEDTEETTDLTEEYLADARAYINKNGVSDEREETERETETEETERKETEDTEETTDLTEEYLADARAYINKNEETERETETEETERKETEDTEETTDLTEEYLADARAYINKNGVSDEREETERETETEETERKETEDTEETTDLTEEYLADARAYINKNGVSGIGEFLKKKLDEWKNVKIRFGITGDSGTGKSTFINAIRGYYGKRIELGKEESQNKTYLCFQGCKITDYENDAAEVGVTETTRKPKEYTYPGKPKITLVDLPGIGTPNYPDLPTYCEKVDLEKYDTFLIFTADRFTQYDLKLAEKVKSLGKSFFLIRTKIDEALRSHRGKARIDKEATLRKIRIYCMDNVKGLISSEKEIFLIGNYDKEKWDFDCLVKTIGRALPIVQREGLILSLSDLTRGCLNRKAMFLKARAVAVATISARNGVIPIPRWGAVLDAKLIRDTIEEYHIRLGLHDITSDTFEEFNKYEKVLQIYKFQSDEELLLSLNSEAHGLRKVQEVSKYIPILGTLIAGSISFVLMSRYLERCVDELEVVALAVWDDAAKRSTENDSETSTNNSDTH
ncbi:interferon-inducible GTPase 5-like, partial [Paramuricea clavata]